MITSDQINKSVTCASLTELDAYAKHVASVVSEGGVIALQGQLGAGKTTFTKFLAAHLGVKTMIVSPTFTVIQEYPLKDRRTLYHLDLYRLRQPEELVELGIDDLFEEDRSSIILIEWPEMILDKLPKNALLLEFTVQDEETRVITVKKI